MKNPYIRAHMKPKLPKLKLTHPCGLLWLVAWLGASSCSFAAPLDKFLGEYCIKCHGPEKQKGDRRFDRLTPTIKTPDDALLWQEILDQLNKGEMPPKKEKQPSKTELLAVVDAITQSVADATLRFKGTAAHTVLRRLNSYEYQQTIGDLLGLNVAGWNPAANFPPEVRAGGFDNDAGAQVTSGMLLDHYFIAAEEAIKRATAFGPKPELKSYAQKSPFYFEKQRRKFDLPKVFQTDRYRWCRKPATMISSRGITAEVTLGSSLWVTAAHRRAGVTPSASRPPPSTARIPTTS